MCVIFSHMDMYPHCSSDLEILTVCQFSHYILRLIHQVIGMPIINKEQIGWAGRGEALFTCCRMHSNFLYVGSKETKRNFT